MAEPVDKLGFEDLNPGDRVYTLAETIDTSGLEEPGQELTPEDILIEGVVVQDHWGGKWLVPIRGAEPIRTAEPQRALLAYPVCHLTASFRTIPDAVRYAAQRERLVEQSCRCLAEALEHLAQRWALKRRIPGDPEGAIPGAPD